MMNAVRLEWYKLRRKRLLGMITLLLLVELAWAFMATSVSISRNPEHAGWESLIATVSSMNGLFLPILTAICVSRICDMEHKGNTWKLLRTVMVSPGQLYAAKFMTASIMGLWGCIFQVFSIFVFGMLNDFNPAVPVVLLTRFLLGTMITTLAIITLQLWISVAVKNQAFALSLGMIGGFIGLTADLLPSGLRRLLVWSYYSGLSPIAQSYESEQMSLAVRDIGTLLPVMALLAVVGAALYLAGNIYVSKREL